MRMKKTEEREIKWDLMNRNKWSNNEDKNIYFLAIFLTENKKKVQNYEKKINCHTD